jgi:hypothetical protein
MVIEEIVRRRVIQLWLSGEARDKIAIDNNIGSGTVSSIVNNYKIGLENLDFASFRELMVEAKKQGLTPSDLASHVRLNNYLVKSGAAEQEVESFVTNVNSGYIPLGKAIELINQIYEISKSQSVSPDQLPDYIKQKLVEKQRIDDDIQQADAILQSKNVAVEAINEYLKLNEELEKHGLSTHDIHKLLSVLSNAKKYGFGGKEIAEKLWNIQELEWNEKELKDKCKKLSKRISKYKAVVPLTQEIAAFGIGIDELLAFKIGVREAAKHYNLPFVSATLRLIDDIKKYNKINGLKKELSRLSQQVFVVNGVWANQNKAMMAMLNLQSRGITEDRILQLNSFLENNGYKDMRSNS